MTKADAETFAFNLIKRGYKKWTQAKYGDEDYDVSRMIRDDDGEPMYQIIYRFWDWTKYTKAQYEFSVDVVFMPCLNIYGRYGRADLILSNYESKNYLDTEWTEKFAKEYYDFITERL